MGKRTFQKGQHGLKAEVEKAFPYPVFVKPATLGSSVGMTKVHDAGELAPALHLACAYGMKVLVETAVVAREIEVSVLGRRNTTGDPGGPPA